MIAAAADEAPLREWHLAFLTDGAPRSRAYWSAGFRGNRRQYAMARRREARAAARLLAVPARCLHFGPFADQELHLHLAAAAQWLGELARVLAPVEVYAPAYEGGHPDHEAANFLAAQVFSAAGARLWEYSLYTVSRGRTRFLRPVGTGWRRLALTGRRRRAKRLALARHASQRATLRAFPLGAEYIRPLPSRDYSAPARDEPAVWERWGWPIRARDLCARFAAFGKETDQENGPARTHAGFRAKQCRIPSPWRSAAGSSPLPTR